MSRRLEDGNDHHRDGNGGTSDADDAQEMLAIGNGLGIIDEKFDDGNGTCKKIDRADRRNDERIQKRRLDRRAHTRIILCGEVIADQGKHALRHTVCDRKGKHIDLLGDTHARDGLIGVRYDHFVEHDIGERTHQHHQKARETDKQDLLRNTVAQGIIAGRKFDDGVIAVFIKEHEEIARCDQIGKHRRDRRALDTELHRENKDRVENDIKDTAERHADAGFLGIALRAHKMCKTSVHNRWNTADGDRPQNVIRAKIIGCRIRAEQRENKGAEKIHRKAVNKSDRGSGIDTECRASPCFFAVTLAQTARDQTRTADTEKIGDTRQHNEGRHRQRRGGDLIRIVHLTDKEGIRHIIKHRDDLADDGRYHERNDRLRDRNPLKKSGIISFHKNLLKYFDILINQL